MSFLTLNQQGAVAVMLVVVVWYIMWLVLVQYVCLLVVCGV